MMVVGFVLLQVLLESERVVHEVFELLESPHALLRTRVLRHDQLQELRVPHLVEESQRRVDSVQFFQQVVDGYGTVSVSIDVLEGSRQIFVACVEGEFLSLICFVVCVVA